MSLRRRPASPYRPRAVSALQQRQDACRLRAEGKSYVEIGQLLNCTPEKAYRLVTQEMKRRREDLAETVDHLTQLHMERLEKTWAALEPLIASGNIKAAEAGLKVLERQARLKGLDQPQKLEATLDIYDMTDDELLEQRRRTGLATQGIVIPQLLPGETSLSPPLLTGPLVQDAEVLASSPSSSSSSSSSSST